MAEERHEVVVSVACLDRGAEERLDLPRQGQQDAAGLSRVEHEVDVLLHQVRGERSRVVVAQQRLGLVLDERRADGRVAHRLEQCSPGNTGRLPENERLGHQLREPGDDKVDRELHDASLLRVADDVDGRPDRAQHRLGAVESGTRSRDDEGEVPGQHDAGVAAHGSAQVQDRRTVGERRDPSRHVRRDRAQVDEDRPRPRCARHGSRDGSERIVVGERSEDDVDGGGELGGSFRDRRAARSQRLRPLAAPVVDDEVVACVEKALRDRAAHVAEPDQPNGRTRVLTGAHCSV